MDESKANPIIRLRDAEEILRKSELTNTNQETPESTTSAEDEAISLKLEKFKKAYYDDIQSGFNLLALRKLEGYYYKLQYLTGNQKLIDDFNTFRKDRQEEYNNYMRSKLNKF